MALLTSLMESAIKLKIASPITDASEKGISTYIKIYYKRDSNLVICVLGVFVEEPVHKHCKERSKRATHTI